MFTVIAFVVMAAGSVVTLPLAIAMDVMTFFQYDLTKLAWNACPRLLWAIVCFLKTQRRNAR